MSLFNESSKQSLSASQIQTVRFLWIQQKCCLYTDFREFTLDLLSQFRSCVTPRPGSPIRQRFRSPTTWRFRFPLTQRSRSPITQRSRCVLPTRGPGVIFTRTISQPTISHIKFNSKTDDKQQERIEPADYSYKRMEFLARYVWRYIVIVTSRRHWNKTPAPRSWTSSVQVTLCMLSVFSLTAWRSGLMLLTIKQGW